MNKTLAAVLDAARACRWTAYDEDRGTGLCAIPAAQLLRRGGAGHVGHARPRPARQQEFLHGSAQKAPLVVSIVQNINPTCPVPCWAAARKTLYGPGFVLDTLCGTQFAISSRSFYQVNRTQTEVLHKKALELAS